MVERLEIPKHWEYISLVEDLNYVPTGVEAYEGEKLYYSTGSIKEKGHIPEGMYTFSDRPSRANRSVQENDVLQARMKGTNKVLLIDDHLDGTLFSTGFFQVRPYGETYIPKFLYYYLGASVFLKEKDALCSGSTQSALNDTNARKIKIPLPPMGEQKRIVVKIEELFSELDNSIESLNKAKLKLALYRQSVLKSAFEGELTKAWREAHQDELDDAETLLEHIKKEREAAYEKSLDEWEKAIKAWEASGKEGKRPAKPRKLKDFSPFSVEDEKQFTFIPKEWQRVKLEWLGEVQLGRQRSPKYVSKKYPTKYIRAANITEQGISTDDVLDMEFTPDEVKRYIMKNGDIVVAEASGSPDQVGKPAIWKNQIENCCFQNTVIRLRPFIRMSEYIFWYLKYLYMSGMLAKLAGGVGINHLSAGTFASIVSPICSLEEQHQIVNEIGSRLSEANAMEKVIDKSLQKAERLRQSILKKAFEGKLVPKYANDESVSELLMRIKEGKGTQ